MVEVVSLLNGIKKIKTNRKAWRLIFVIAIIAVVLLSGTVITVNKYRKALKMQIEDKNGEDKTLCVITDEMIEAYDHTYYSIKHSIYCEGLNSSNIVGELEKFDNSYVKVRSKKLSGVYLCNVYLGDGEMVNFSIKSSVAKGNFKIVFTDSKGKIIQTIPIDQTVDIQFMALSNELYFLKCVGESADFELEIIRSKAE